MPNWCFNSMTIDKKYKNKIVNDKEEVDFNIMVPMPESLHVTAGGTNDSDMYVYLSDKLTKSLDEVRKDEHSKLIENMFDKDWIKTVFERAKADPDLQDAKKMEEAYQRGSVLISNFDNYGAINWYDWAIANWGTKWNACDSDCSHVDEGWITFDTAWCMPEPIIKKIMLDNHDCEISITWRNEDYDGTRTYRHDGHGGYFLTSKWETEYGYQEEEDGEG